MKRSPLAILLLLVAAVAVLFLVLRPNGWLAEERATGASPPLAEDPPGDAAEHADALPEPAAEPAAEAVREPERRAIDPALASGRSSFRVIDFAGRPVAGAQLLLVRDEALLAEALTDAEGEVDFEADETPARLILAVEHRPLEAREVALVPGQQELALREGGRLSGRFVGEDGASPGELKYSLASNSPLSPGLELPESVENALRVWTLRTAYVALKSDEEGCFELTGLPESWSGHLWLRGDWKLLSSSHGLDQPNRRGVRLTALIEGLVLHVAKQRTLHGRLVLQSDGSPLERATLSMKLRSPDTESPAVASTRTDEDGRFSFDRELERISSLDLRLGGRFDESPSILELAGASVPTDGDLGDVIVDAARHVPFLLQDPEGSPIARGVAIAAGVRSEPTGKDGRGELRWIARSVDRLFAEAEGFVPAEAEIPPVVGSPLPITLMHANELVVTLRLPDGADPSQFKIVLRGGERITALPFEDFSRQSAHVDPWDHLAHYSFPGLAPDTYLSAHTWGDSRTASFKALRPGVELELLVRGITGDMVYHSETLAPLAPTERREVEVPLEEGLVVFRGRVLDQDGNPLARAHLQLTGQILGWADEEGRFLCFLTGPETGTLLIQHQACATKYLHDYTIPTHGEPVEFRLNPARQVTIEVVDESGAPVPQPEVWREYGGFTANTFRVEGNRHVSPSVPEETFVFMVRVAGREYRQEHDPAVPEARLVLPVHGSLTALLPAATTTHRGGRFSLQLTPPEGDPGQPLVESRDSAANLRLEFPLVFPGTYQASLRYEPTEEEQAAGREAESAAPVTVVVEPARETELRIGL